ncbi:glycoside hydrolase family 6 protein [Nonomuraea turcica]|uniref:glycoside hydrolase family 6 protein n=1 Tax=Nonomuraea sp. G32 TaxID=3067274 RepID=UPI00273B9890|nr:glycoside hydrolase family 6 protein [Nonomuraea sp. G32]MDP4509731.1 glycoside hydrolase family 6 protein [Nonomuraea sp. G32]
MTLEALRDGDPRRVGPYALLGRLGEGGMGVVYLGQGPDDTRVAVKLIHARMDTDAGFRRRFAREVAAAQRVARFCTAPVLDADVEGEVAYLVTEYVEGPSLESVVRESGPLTGSALDGLAAAMAMALRAIHGAGVVHRDLKPSNVLLSQVGPKVIDFGIAQLADAEMSSMIVGTPAYMSPEHVSGARIGPASDIFSWGCTVGFAAGGVPPFGSGSVPTILLRILNEPPDLRGLSGPLHDLVLAATAKTPADRPTAQDLLDRLSASASSPPSTARPSAAGPAPATPADTDTDAASPGATGPGQAISDAAESAAAESAATESAATESAATESAATESAAAESAVTPAAARRRRLLAVAAAVVVAVAGTSAALVWRGQGAAVGVQDQKGRGEATAQAAAQHPLRAQDNVRFYAPAEPAASRQADQWAEERPQDAELMRKLAAVPYAIRLGEPEVRAKIDQVISGAEQAGGVPVFLINYMPGSDCKPAAPADLAAYQEWIKGVAGQIGSAKAVVILEPGSLVKISGAKDCDPQGSPDQRYQDLRKAAQTLKANPGTAVYLDGSQDLYPGTEIMAERLVGAGIDKVDGFFVNTAGYQRTARAVAYGKSLSACIGIRLATGDKTCPSSTTVDPPTMPHFVVDTARNGQGTWAPAEHYKDPQTWCNPPGRGVGDRPTTATGEDLVDAYLWITKAGASSGRCRRGTDGEKDPARGVVAPEAGEWWGEMALERAKSANPPLR